MDLGPEEKFNDINNFLKMIILIFIIIFAILLLAEWLGIVDFITGPIGVTGNGAGFLPDFFRLR